MIKTTPIKQIWQKILLELDIYFKDQCQYSLGKRKNLEGTIWFVFQDMATFKGSFHPAQTFYFRRGSKVNRC